MNKKRVAIAFVCLIVLIGGVGLVAAQTWTGDTTEETSVNDGDDGFDEATVDNLELDDGEFVLGNVDESLDYVVEESITDGPETFDTPVPLHFELKEVEAEIFGNHPEGANVEVEATLPDGTNGSEYFPSGESTTKTIIDENDIGDGLDQTPDEITFEYLGIGADGVYVVEIFYHGEIRAQDASYENTHDVTYALEGEVVLESTNMVGSAVWEGYDGDEWREIGSTDFSTTGSHSADLTDASDEIYQFRVNLDTEIDDDSNEDYQLKLSEESITYEDHGPELSDPDPEDGEQLTTDDVTLEIDVDHPDFETDSGETVSVTFYDDDDSELGTDTVTDTGTASTGHDSVEMGANKWYVVAEDSTGKETETSILTFHTPNELEIRNESDPGQLVTTDADVEVTFFGGGHVETRTTTDGTVDMDGLPLEEFTVQVEADGYYTRQSIIRSITEQQTVFALPEDADTVSTRFVLDDATGEFTGE